MKALTWLGEYFSLRASTPRVPVVAADDAVGDQAFVLLDQRVLVAPADQALDGVERIGRVGNGLALGALADKALAAVAERDHARRGAGAFRVLDDARVAGSLAFHDGDAGIGSAEVDADDLAHACLLVSGLTQPEALPAALLVNEINVLFAQPSDKVRSA